MVAWDPVFVIGFGAGGDGWGLGVGGYAGVNFLGGAGWAAGAGRLFLLREVRGDPDCVEEVTDAGGAG